jgi:hypothetical protein
MTKKDPANPSQWSDEKYRAKGLGRLTLRLPLDVLDAIASEAKRLGLGKAALICRIFSKKARSLKKVTPKP